MSLAHATMSSWHSTLVVRYLLRTFHQGIEHLCGAIWPTRRAENLRAGLYCSSARTRASSSNVTTGMLKEAKIVVGLDFGTTFPGFAYALRADPDTVYTFYDWPMQAASGGIPYCKPQTSLLYADGRDTKSDPYELRDWGWPAFVKYKCVGADPSRGASGSDRKRKPPKYVLKEEVDEDFQVIHNVNSSAFERTASKQAGCESSSGTGYFLTLFKLHLATKGTSTANDGGGALPPGMTAKRAIIDYLSRMSKFILRELRNKFGTHITLDDVQWCLAVPAIWDEQAKRVLLHCAGEAELVRGPNSKEAGSPHPVKLVIEPEAASVYCQLKLKDHSWTKGDKFLVVVCGGGTVDLVLHEKLRSAPSMSVREVQEGSGGVCGGSQVDDEFLAFLRRRIPCFTTFERGHPAIALAFRQGWERLKYDFEGTENDAVRIDLPPTLATMWEREQASSKSSALRSSTRKLCSYDEIELSKQDMQSIFDPVVNRALQLVEARVVCDLQAIVVVGGFSASPCLMRRMKSSFGGRVAAIVSPPYPRSAVCSGAVTMAIRSETVVSRISKRTYGISLIETFIDGVHPKNLKIEGDSGEFFCEGVFSKFVSKGDGVRNDDCVKHPIWPSRRRHTSIDIEIYSTVCENPKYVSDPGMKKEGTIVIQCPSYYTLGEWPLVNVSMYFGRTEIRVTAIGTNFDSKKMEMLPVKFEMDSIY